MREWVWVRMGMRVRRRLLLLGFWVRVGMLCRSLILLPFGRVRVRLRFGLGVRLLERVLGMSVAALCWVILSGMLFVVLATSLIKLRRHCSRSRDGEGDEDGERGQLHGNDLVREGLQQLGIS